MDLSPAQLPHSEAVRSDRSTGVETRYDPTAYLRVALTYMLISMPHGTSTIFGAFQAIVALLLVKPDVSAPLFKLLPAEKFAS